MWYWPSCLIVYLTKCQNNFRRDKVNLALAKCCLGVWLRGCYSLLGNRQIIFHLPWWKINKTSCSICNNSMSHSEFMQGIKVLRIITIGKIQRQKKVNKDPWVLGCTGSPVVNQLICAFAWLKESITLIGKAESEQLNARSRHTLPISSSGIIRRMQCEALNSQCQWKVDSILADFCFGASSNFSDGEFEVV